MQSAGDSPLISKLIFFESYRNGQGTLERNFFVNSHDRGVGYMNNEKEIRKDMIKQLKDRNILESHYISLVDDYMELWNIKNLLIADINERGVNVEWNNGGGQSGVKKNDSVNELVRVNAQMLKILSELGIRGADIKHIEYDDEL